MRQVWLWTSLPYRRWIILTDGEFLTDHQSVEEPVNLVDWRICLHLAQERRRLAGLYVQRLELALRRELIEQTDRWLRSVLI